MLQAQGLISADHGVAVPRTVIHDSSGLLRKALLYLVALEQVDLGDLVELRIALESAALKRTRGRSEGAAPEEARRALDAMRGCRR